MRPNHTKGFIFDFDGVILDSATIKTDAFLELFNKHPEHLQAIKAYHLQHQGITRYKKFEWIYRELLNDEYTEKLEGYLDYRFSEIVLEKIRETEPMPGAHELLKYLKKHSIPAFIASGTPDVELYEIVEQRKLSGYFQSIYGSNLTKEEAIDVIAEENEFYSSELLFIGDAITDYEAATSREVPFVAVYSEAMEAFWKEKQIAPIYNLMEILKKMDIDAV